MFALKGIQPTRCEGTPWLMHNIKASIYLYLRKHLIAMYKAYSKHIIDGKCVLPDSITKIEDLSFFGFKELTSIDIPDSVLEIGYSAFILLYGTSDN
ncbi:MAG: leucine-rich repeat protein [Candidatus Cryptobacteroides sp.]